MSRRRRRAPGDAGGPAGAPGATGGPAGPPPRRPKGAARGLPAQLALLIAAFAATVGVAELAGAASLGVALGIGQIVFAVALVVLLIRA